ncbi:MAG: ATP-binding protein [Methanoregula sp.]|nr:ATP-binding protein [Methanoregula sp.]
MSRHDRWQDTGQVDNCTGTSLATVKRIIEAHGGKIGVESEGPGKGSTFRFTLPRGCRCRHR